MLGIRDVGLFQHAILVLADEIIRDMLLKRQLRLFFARHERFPPLIVFSTGALVESSSRTVAPQAGQRKRARDSSSKRDPVSSSSASGRQVKSPPPPAATFSISPQSVHSKSSWSLANSPNARAFACKAAISVASARSFVMPRFMIWPDCVSPDSEQAFRRGGGLASSLPGLKPLAPLRSKLWPRGAAWSTSGLRKRAILAG